VPERRAPGWYDDAADAALLRYWDGTKWSPHTAPRPGVDHEAEDPGDRLAALFGSVAPTVTVTMPLRAPDEHTTVPLPDQPTAAAPRERRDRRGRVGGRR
jgi:hypothetical protein